MPPVSFDISPIIQCYQNTPFGNPNLNYSAGTLRMFEEYSEKISQISNNLNNGAHLSGAFKSRAWNDTAAITYGIIDDETKSNLRNRGIISAPLSNGGHTVDDKKLHQELDAIGKRLNHPAENDKYTKRLAAFVIGRSHMKNTINAWSSRWRVRNRTYIENNNGLYPVKDMNGNPIKIKKISQTPEIGFNDDVSKVKPFISSKLTSDQRKSLYAKVKCVKFSADHMKHAGEAVLIGQDAVEAAEDLKKGDCIGVYAGHFLTDDAVTKLTEYAALDDSRLLSCDGKDASKYKKIDGDNVLSKINSIFARDETGKVSRQAESGYNIDGAKYKVELEDGSITYIAAYFASKDIKKNEELRWDYGYCPKIIDAILGAGK